jgi:hypothetical protein
MSSLKMSSLVISVTKAHIVSGRRPRVRVIRTSFKMGRDFSDTVCSVKPGFAPVANVTRHGLSPSQPRVTRLVSVFPDCRSTPNGGLYAYAGVCPSPPALSRFPTVVHISRSFLSCYLFAIPNFSVIPACFLVIHRLVSDADYFLLPFRSGLVLHSSSILIASRL